MTNAKDTRIGSGGKIAFELGRRCHGNAARILGRAMRPKARQGFLERSESGAAQYRQTRIFGEAGIGKGELAEVITRFVLSRHGPAI